MDIQHSAYYYILYTSYCRGQEIVKLGGVHYMFLTSYNLTQKTYIMHNDTLNLNLIRRDERARSKDYGPLLTL